MVDIEGVVAKVCARVLGDSAASPEVRAARARGLRELGLIFTQTKVPPGAPMPPAPGGGEEGGKGI